jgi:phospholipase C
MAWNGMDRIKHLIVVIMENRSFDNLLGFLYADQKNEPLIRSYLITTFNGLNS